MQYKADQCCRQNEADNRGPLKYSAAQETDGTALEADVPAAIVKPHTMALTDSASAVAVADSYDMPKTTDGSVGSKYKCGSALRLPPTGTEKIQRKQFSSDTDNTHVRLSISTSNVGKKRATEDLGVVETKTLVREWHDSAR